jgi:hypothetical protein
MYYIIIIKKQLAINTFIYLYNIIKHHQKKEEYFKSCKFFKHAHPHEIK